MKHALLLSLSLIPACALGELLVPTDTFVDPRKAETLVKYLEKGKHTMGWKNIAAALLIVCWADTPVERNEEYQIEGEGKRVGSDFTIRFLKHFYRRSEEAGRPAPALIFASRGIVQPWIPGKMLTEIKSLSAKHDFDVYLAGGFPFKKVDPMGYRNKAWHLEIRDTRTAVAKERESEGVESTK
jgi:hypothetical protein